MKVLLTALYNSGFNSSSRLYEKAADELGMTPATYSRGGRGANIRYTISDSALGRLLVAVTERGVCAVKMADTDEELESDCAKNCPRQNSTRRRGSTRHGQRKCFELSFRPDNRSSTCLWTSGQLLFKDRYGKNLRPIPYGETRSYADIAKRWKARCGPRVGRACGANPVALVIPCHRVVREDKSLGGYRWGLGEEEEAVGARAEGSVRINVR